mgnify:CR=1 FL=1|tara:strand:- start:45 stop:845 length:801 start_codon:yes stop_codon:yes gene_type:complete
MAIYDCFQYFNEDHIVDLRLNILNEYVDYFVISESTKTHQGKVKKINFDISKFKKFKHKIKFIIADFKEDITFQKHMGGESPIEQHQRNSLIKGIENADPNDLIFLSDSDEIPDFKKINEIKKSKRFVAFSHQMFMYKLNLQNINENNWIGTRMTRKKHLTTMQELRNLKFKNYPFWRLDKLNLQILKGGWHFSFLLTPDQIVEKINSFSHGEFNQKKINKNDIENKIAKNEDIFDRGYLLKKISINNEFPDYIIKNKKELSKWIL